MQEFRQLPDLRAVAARLVRFAILPLGLAAGLGAAFLALSPRVLSTNPPDGGRAASNAAVEIAFSTAMDAACVESRFSVDPPLDGDFLWDGSTLRFTPASAWPAGRTVRVRVASGACSARGLPLGRDVTFAFTPNEPRVAYLRRTEDLYRLMAVGASGGEAEVLLESRTPIFEFDISPDGKWIAFSSRRAENDYRIEWFAPGGAAPETLLECGSVQCHSPLFSPDGSRIAFERFFWPAGAVGEAPVASISILDLGTRRETSVSVPGHTSANPLWHPRGWLSYFDSTDRTILLDDLQGGRTVIPTTAGGNWDWSPDGAWAVFAEVQPPLLPAGEENEEESEQPLHLTSHLILAERTSNRTEDLTGAEPADDSSPVYSPDGLCLAFGRQYLDARFTPGRQLLVLELSTHRVRALTDDPAYWNSAFRWSADGGRIAFMRLAADALGQPASLWIIRADGGGLLQLAPEGYLPHWLP